MQPPFVSWESERSVPSSRNVDVSVVASATSWIEGEAVAQLEATARLLGVVRAVGLPDLHPGRGTPIGAVFFSEGLLYPHLVGADIGCGMGLFRTGICARSAKRDRWAKRLSGLETEWDGDAAAFLAARGVAASEFEGALGTIGGGNHFAELVRVERLVDEAACERLGLAADELSVLVHSGSRGLGDAILRRHTSVRGAEGLEAMSEEGERYLAAHDHAVAWAAANRALIADRFIEQLSGASAPLLDVVHNAVTRRGDQWLHRKGAAPHDAGPVVVPGSRGSFSYLIVPEGDGVAGGFSLPHGAGRKWKRSDARARVRASDRREQLEQTALGSRVICEDKDLLYEEAPAAYKDIDRVIADTESHGLARTIAVLRPVLTYKVRRSIEVFGQ